MHYSEMQEIFLFFRFIQNKTYPMIHDSFTWKPFLPSFKTNTNDFYPTTIRTKGMCCLILGKVKRTRLPGQLDHELLWCLAALRSSPQSLLWVDSLEAALSPLWICSIFSERRGHLFPGNFKDLEGLDWPSLLSMSVPKPVIMTSEPKCPQSGLTRCSFLELGIRMG
jgi:hypothetical protein